MPTRRWQKSRHGAVHHHVVAAVRRDCRAGSACVRDGGRAVAGRMRGAHTNRAILLRHLRARPCDFKGRGHPRRERVRADPARTSRFTLAGRSAGSRRHDHSLARLGAATPGSAPAPCSRLAMPLAAPALGIAPGLVQRLPRSDDFLQTRRLSVSTTPFDRQWSRVSRETLSRGVVTGNAALRRHAAGPVGEAALAAVNAWANGHIRYVEDRDLYGKADYWAGARTTLKRGAGDCEDIALAQAAAARRDRRPARRHDPDDRPRPGAQCRPRRADGAPGRQATGCSTTPPTEVLDAVQQPRIPPDPVSSAPAPVAPRGPPDRTAPS